MKKLIIFFCLNLLSYEKVFKINNFHLTPNDCQAIEAIWKHLSPTQEKIIFDTESSIIAVQSTNKNRILELQQLIQQLDAPPVNIQFEIVAGRIIDNDAFVFGINDFALYNKESKKDFGFQGLGGRLTDFPMPTVGLPGHAHLLVNPNNFNINNLVTQPILSTRTPIRTEGLSLPITLGGKSINKDRLTSYIQALHQNSVIKITNEIEVKTKSGEKIKFVIGNDVPYYSSKLITAPNGHVQQKFTLYFKQYGVLTEISAKVIDKNIIDLELFFERSNLDIPPQILFANIYVIPPTFGIYKIYDRIYLKSGESYMLTHFTHEQRIEQITQTPILDRIPLLKKIFQSKNYEYAHEDEFIMITAKILE